MTVRWLRVGGIILSLVGAALSLAIWFGWCLGDGCGKPLEFLSVPISLWGVGFYNVTAALLTFGYRQLLLVLLGVGIIGHGILYQQMFLTGDVCAGCLIAGGVTLGIFILALALDRNLLHVIVVATAGVIFLVGGGLAGYAGASPGRTPIPLVVEIIEKQGEDAFLVPTWTADGQEVFLDANKKPVLYFGFSCAYCSDVLEYVANLPDDNRPYLLSAVADDQEKTIQETQDKLAAAGLWEADVFYGSLNIRSVPVLLVPYESQIVEVSGRRAVIDFLDSR